MSKAGKFIVLEGLEGAGKTTVLSHVKALLEARGQAVTTTREPGGTAIGERIRAVVTEVRDEDPPVSEAELLLMYASRMQLVRKVIQPALQQGDWVVSDRFADSTLAYQGGGRGLDVAWIQSLHDLLLADFKPDLVLYLDIEPAIGLQRAARRSAADRFESEQLAFFERVRQQYLQLCEQRAEMISIDAAASPEHVADAVEQAVLALAE